MKKNFCEGAGCTFSYCGFRVLTGCKNNADGGSNGAVADLLA